MSSSSPSPDRIPRSSIAQYTSHNNYDLAPYMSTPQSISPLSSVDIELLTSTAESQQSQQFARIESHRPSSFAFAQALQRPTPITNIQQQLSLDRYSWDDQATYIPVHSAYSVPTAWSTYFGDESSKSMGYPAVSPVTGLKRQRSHQRTPSASTVASNGPASPYNFNIANPQIANTDFDPIYSNAFLKDPTVISDPAYLSANYIPVQNTGMKGFTIDNSHNFDDLPSPGSSRLSMTTADRASPVTPGSAPEDADTKQVKNGFTEHRPFNPHIQLSRTESAAYQDELYNPANFQARAVKKTTPPKQAPTSNTLVKQRLQTANMARSASPNSAVSRERSPFRTGSDQAPTEPWSAANTAASRRQQQKEEREEAEYAIHRPQLQREPTKTISPKDALLEYNETDAPSLFQDTIPIGYKQHLGTETLTNAYLPQQTPTFTLPPTSSQTSMAGFRASSADAFSNAGFDFPPPALPATTAMQNPYQLNNYQQVSHLTPTYPATSVDQTPDFPAHLTSMESSISEGPPMSSQESSTATLQRPADTRANTGTYTCTYHGCTQRFESPASLQRHKRDYHRSQQHIKDNTSAETSSASPRSTESPDPSGSGLTSAQILARNSQAGPHKCTRINPSTGKPCNTIFSRPYDLTRHEDTIHNGRKQKVRCPYCREEKTFSRNDALTRHMRVVHPDVENFGKRGRRGD